MADALPPYCYSPLKLHLTCHVTSSLPYLHLPPSHLPPSWKEGGDWPVLSQAQLLSWTQSAACGQGCLVVVVASTCHPWRNFSKHGNSWEIFLRKTAYFFFHSRNSLCLDSLSVVFLSPTKTDLFCLTWWSTAETRCCSRTRRAEGHGAGEESVWFPHSLLQKAADSRAAVMLLAQRHNGTDWRTCLRSTDPSDLFWASKLRMSAN